MDQPCMGCYMEFIIAIHLPLFHHSTLVSGLINSILSHVDDMHVLKESYGVLFQPHVWANDDVIVTLYHVFESLVQRI